MGRDRQPIVPAGGPRAALGATLPAGLVLAGALLALGAQDRWIGLAAAVGAAGAAALLGLRRPGPLGAAAWGLAGLAAWSALQAVPLPPAVLGWVSPVAAECWSSARALAGVAPGWSPISLDPGATLHEAQRWLGHAAAAAVGARVAALHGVRPVALLVAALAALLALVLLAHGLLGATALYGLITPSFPVGSWGLAPLLNPNNRAGFLALGGFAALAAALGRGLEPYRPGLVALGATLLAGSAAQGSRAGLAAVALGGLGLGLRVLRRRRGAREGSRAGALVALGLLGALALAALALPRETWLALLAERREKLDVIAWAVPLVRDHALVGVGRGAFGSVFPAYRQGGGHTWYTHAESFPVQWAADWGLPVAAAALLGLGWLLRSRSGRSSEWHALRVALGVLLLQNLLDLGLEVPAVGLTAALVLGALGSAAAGAPGSAAADLGAPRVAAPGPARGARRRAARPLLGLLAATAVATVAAALGPPAVGEARAELTAARHAGRPAGERLTLARRHLASHPADPVIAREGALAAHAVAGERPLAWAEHALVREPTSGRSQLLTAELFAEGGHWVQAFLHLRLAVEHEPALADAVAGRAATWAERAGPGRWRAAVPSGRAGAGVLARLALQPALAEQRVALLEEAHARAADDPALRAAALDALLGAAERARAPCAPEPARCAARARALFAGGALPRPDALLLEARVLRLEGAAAGARALLDAGCATASDPARCWALRVALGRDEGATAALAHALGARVAAACGTPVACAVACTEVADHHEARGALSEALELRRRAVREDPRPASWLRLARSLARSGQGSAARTAAERVVRDPSATPEERASAAALAAAAPSAAPDGASPPAED